MLRHPLRVLGRLAWFLWVAARALADYFLCYYLRGRRGYRERAKWAHRWAISFANCLHLELDISGAPIQEGVLTANHMGYLDIVALSAIQPLVFVSKSQVRHWPVIGALAACAGTLFVDRRRKSDVARLGPAFAPVINEGVTLVLFPEGTSTGGESVLPFMPSLLEPAAQNGWPVAPAWISYSLPEGEGSVPDEVAYWRDMTFLPHFLNLLSKSAIRVRVVAGPPAPAGLHRKELARLLRERVAEMTGFAPAPANGAEKIAAE